MPFVVATSVAVAAQAPAAVPVPVPVPAPAAAPAAREPQLPKTNRSATAKRISPHSFALLALKGQPGQTARHERTAADPAEPTLARR